MACHTARHLPNTFVDLKNEIPTLILDIRYYGSHNFLGKPVDGYFQPKAIATKEASTALKHVQQELKAQGLGLKIFDAYRPQQAVNHFKAWALALDDTLAKKEFYPTVNKKDLFKLGYIAEKSGHSRGSTIDLTLVDLKTLKELDMGTGFDFFGEPSHHLYQQLSSEQKENRAKLKTIMEKHGFKSYAEEWWHYTLANEPFKDQYFDFPIN
ncbi:M15 family metallopeptidase [Sphingobacterium sp. HJSM2_6]|uniref:M15 family metallopeptidase n=1 Tax=Sphingobacterium sp. HJSM2_6 TaxID=3366264 RepID=UPI003BE52F3A